MPAHRYGYARISTLDQSNTIQRQALEAVGCDRVYEEQASGTSRENRTELDRVLEVLREGDTLVITRIDRLARSMKDLQDIVHELKARGIYLEATEQPVDTNSAAGKAFLDMLGVFAEFETNLRKERQLEGIAKAKDKGVYKGRKPLSEETKQEAITLYRQGIKPAKIIKQTGIGKTSVFKILKGLKDSGRDIGIWHSMRLWIFGLVFVSVMLAAQAESRSAVRGLARLRAIVTALVIPMPEHNRLQSRLTMRVQ